MFGLAERWRLKSLSVTKNAAVSPPSGTSQVASEKRAFEGLVHMPIWSWRMDFGSEKTRF